MLVPFGKNAIIVRLLVFYLKVTFEPPKNLVVKNTVAMLLPQVAFVVCHFYTLLYNLASFMFIKMEIAMAFSLILRFRNVFKYCTFVCYR